MIVSLYQYKNKTKQKQKTKNKTKQFIRKCIEVKTITVLTHIFLLDEQKKEKEKEKEKKKKYSSN